jgi:hypothetical protein
MKNFSLFSLIILLFSSCAPAASTPIAPTTQSTTIIPTSTLEPTSTPSPTLTLTPTITSTPLLPGTIEFLIDKAIPEKFIDVVKTTVNQAYWYYVGLGCSPEFHKVVVKSKELAGNFGLDGINVGWDDLKNISTNMDVRISHEMAHVMCEIQFTKDVNTGEELLWLFEGTANYFSDTERLTNTGLLSGQKGDPVGHASDMGQWVIQNNFCNYPFSSVEKDIEPLGTGALGVKFPDYPGVGGVAAALLAKTSPDGILALINYYKYLLDDSSDIAFQKAFSKTKSEFYHQFQEECSRGFPSLPVANTLPAAEVPLTEMPTQEISILATGVIALKDTTQKFSDFEVVFCNIQSDKCLSAIPVLPDGTFSIQLPVGKYRIRINSRNGAQLLGWYTRQGLVVDPTCAQAITVDIKHETILTINLQSQSC